MFLSPHPSCLASPLTVTLLFPSPSLSFSIPVATSFALPSLFFSFELRPPLATLIQQQGLLVLFGTREIGRKREEGFESWQETMSFMRGDLLTKTRKLVKGLAIAEPRWLKAMEHAPPPIFPSTDGKVKTITLPEDVYVRKFNQNHPDARYEEAYRFCGFDPPPGRVFGQRVLELKEQGVSEDDAIAVADMEYRAEKKAKKKAYSRLKKISRILGKKPPSNPYPSAIKEIQAEERKYVRERFFNPQSRDIIRQLKDERVRTLGW